MKSKNIFLITFFIFLADRISKLIIMNTNFSIFAYHLNKGAFFGFIKDINYFMIVCSILFLIAIIFIFKNKPSLGLAMVFTGVFSNLIDRIFYGGVPDFIDLKFWPIFNTSDILILTGAIIFAINIINEKK